MYVGNLHFKAGPHNISEFLTSIPAVPTILHTKVIMDPGDFEYSAGYGFVTVSDDRAAADLIKKADGHVMMGQKLQVRTAHRASHG